MEGFRRISPTRVHLEGVVWDTNASRAIDIWSDESGYKAHSIRIEDEFYYPIGFVKNTKSIYYEKSGHPAIAQTEPVLESDAGDTEND